MQITSDYIFDGLRFRTNLGLILNQEGQILQILEEGHYDKTNFSYYPGLITPGFINAHCHLELSHLKDKFQTGTGLISFLNAVVSNREYEMPIITQAIKEADDEMYREGIVAVGDISNKTDSIKTKINSKIKYYNFIECFDFMQDQSTSQFIDPYLEVYKSFGRRRRLSVASILWRSMA